MPTDMKVNSWEDLINYLARNWEASDVDSKEKDSIPTKKKEDNIKELD